MGDPMQLCLGTLLATQSPMRQSVRMWDTITSGVVGCVALVNPRVPTPLMSLLSERQPILGLLDAQDADEYTGVGQRVLQTPGVDASTIRRMPRPSVSTYGPFCLLLPSLVVAKISSHAICLGITTSWSCGIQDRFPQTCPMLITR